MVGRAGALEALLRDLKSSEYQFVAVTPATHERVLARQAEGQSELRDLFGWNRPLAEAEIEGAFVDHLRSADALMEENGKLRSGVRVASLGPDLFLHSAFPTHEPDAVFFGPDTYRFVRFVAQHLPRFSAARSLLDMGTGSGAGAIAVARLGDFDRVTMVDVNARALELASINAAVAGIAVDTIRSERIPAAAELIIANPPYMMDGAARSYRDGGDLLGGRIALEWVRQAIELLPRGGAMLLYTGAAYVRGRAPLAEALTQLCAETSTLLEIEEIDPDVFGEELEQPAYQHVERIAAIGVVIVPHKE